MFSIVYKGGISDTEGVLRNDHNYRDESKSQHRKIELERLR